MQDNPSLAPIKWPNSTAIGCDRRRLRASYVIVCMLATILLATACTESNAPTQLRARFKQIPTPYALMLNGSPPPTMQTSTEDDHAWFAFPVDVIGWVGITSEVTAVFYSMPGGYAPIVSLRTFKGNTQVDDRRIGQAPEREKQCGWTPQERLTIDTAGGFHCTTREFFRPCPDSPPVGKYDVITSITAGQVAADGSIQLSYRRAIQPDSSVSPRPAQFNDEEVQGVEK